MTDKWKYEPKTDDELKALALDFIRGRVFSNQQVEQQNVAMVFMPLAMCDQEHLDDLEANDIAMVYEYMDKAGPRSVNGMPCFFSMQMLNMADTQKMIAYAKKLHEAEEAAMASLGKPE